MKAQISKATRLGKAAVFGVGAVVILAALFGTVSMAFAANGKPFILGKKNAARAISTFVKQGAGPALSLRVGANQPPMAVNSDGKVANLNADKVDGLDAGAFLASDGKAADSELLDGKDSADFLAGDGTAVAGGDLSGSYPNPDIATDAVGSNEISADAVGSSEIGSDAVQSSEISTSAVGSDEIGENGVGSEEIATNTVGSSEIATNAVNADEINAGAVGSDEVLDGSMRLGDTTAASRVIQFNPPSLPTGCNNLSVNFTEVEPNDIAWVVPSNSLSSSLSVHPVIQDNPTNVKFRMCNDSSSSVDDVEQPFRITLFRP